jgi:hypothetical protein
LGVGGVLSWYIFVLLHNNFQQQTPTPWISI